MLKMEGKAAGTDYPDPTVAATVPEVEESAAEGVTMQGAANPVKGEERAGFVDCFVTQPVVQSLTVEAQFGKVVLENMVVDLGFMVNLLSTEVSKTLEELLKPISLTLRLANTAVETLTGEAQVTVVVRGTRMKSNFSAVINLGGYDAILGKPWISQVAAASD